jgi:hypothetical protein
MANNGLSGMNSIEERHRTGFARRAPFWSLRHATSVEQVNQPSLVAQRGNYASVLQVLDADGVPTGLLS